MQITYPTSMSPAIAGMLADLSPKAVASYVLEGATDIHFGVGVAQGSTANTCQLPADGAAATALLGVTLHSHAYANAGLAGDTGLTPGDTVNVLRQGAVYVEVTDAVTAGGPVYWVHTGADKGKFRGTADANTVQIPNARFRAAAAAGELAVLELNLP